MKMAKTEKIKPKDKPHYVNNAQFSQSVVDYCTLVKEAKESGGKQPIIPDYIATCFLKICEGLSHKANFVRYTYREEMVMDAVENCLKAISNYNIEAATRTGKPNAFSYFTQITWFAFLRRIAKEKKQQDVKMKYLTSSGIENFLINENGDETSRQVAEFFVDTLKTRIDRVKSIDNNLKEYDKTEKKKKKRSVNVDSDLSEFMK